MAGELVTGGSGWRRWIPALLAACAVALGIAQPADAVPIRGLTVTPGYDQVEFRATIISPPSARGCIANVQARVFATDRIRRIKSLGNHRVNVCSTVRNGTGVGVVRGWFAMGNIRAGRYALCLRAVQDQWRGGRSAHFECRLFRWYGS